MAGSKARRWHHLLMLVVAFVALVAASAATVSHAQDAPGLPPDPTDSQPLLAPAAGDAPQVAPAMEAATPPQPDTDLQDPITLEAAPEPVAPPSDAAPETRVGDESGAGFIDAHATDAGHDEVALVDAAHAEAHYGPSLVAKVFNFIVFVGILAFLLGRPIAAFFRQRKANIANSLEAAEIAQLEAQAKLADTERRLAGIETQIDEILARAREQAAAEHALILEQAKADAARLLGQAEAQVGDLESAAVRRLRSVAANLAVELARELVEQQLQPKDREEIFNRTLSRLQKAAS